MVDIAINISKLRQQIPPTVKIVAVSKTRTEADILVAYNAGHRCFGENRVQELQSKKVNLPGDIEWHLIGHLQSNKVKQVVPFVDMIQSVDSLHLLLIINNESAKINRIINCLIQFHIAKEETKSGFNMEEVVQMVESDQFSSLSNVRVCGVMGMATFSEDMSIVRQEFIYLRNCYNDLKEKYFSGVDYFKEISMGMSGDFRVAVEEGSTIIRIGTLIFGERENN
jgi:pyridoxal phosphate enzyme (YggS family)